MPIEASEMLRMLRRQGEWRFFVDGTRNLGHQASTAMMIKRLVDLSGFTGRIVVAYADYGKGHLGRTLPKLALLFAGLDPTASNQEVSYGPCARIRFVDIEDREALQHSVSFGFTGGADDLSENYAEQLNVRFFCRLQPYLWDDASCGKDDPYYESSRIEQPGDRYLYLVDACPEFRLSPVRFEPRVDPSELSDTTSWYAHRQCFDPDLTVRTRNWLALADACREARRSGTPFLCWPLYGLHHFPDAAGDILLACVLTAILVQVTTGMGIVLMDFSPTNELEGWDATVGPLSKELAQGAPFDEALDRAAAGHSSAAVGRDQLNSLIAELGFSPASMRAGKTSIHIHHGYDPSTGRALDLRARFASLAASASRTPAIHVVALGLVPSDLFTRSLLDSELPAIIEGQTTASLLGTHGKPFLQLLRIEHAIKQCYRTRPGNVGDASMVERMSRTAAALRDANIGSCLRSQDPFASIRYARDIRECADVLIASLNKASDVHSYFRALASHDGEALHDKLMLGLVALREVVRAQRRNVPRDMALPSDQTNVEANELRPSTCRVVRGCGKAALLIRPLAHSIGAEVSGINLDEPQTSRERQELNAAWLKYGVLVFPSQAISDVTHARFARQFGKLVVFRQNHPDVCKTPEIYRTSNADDAGNPLSPDTMEARLVQINWRWHIDGCYCAVPPRGVMLRSVDISGDCGDTHFADLSAAYEELPARTRARINRLVSQHSFDCMVKRCSLPALSEEELHRLGTVHHPLVRQHPCGRRSLFLSPPYMAGIVGMSDDASRALLQELTEWATQERFLYRHAWRPDDLVLWENGWLMHRVMPYILARSVRVMHGATLAGVEPVRAIDPVEQQN
jgi:alpha-ketoglutarate-dependent taurine dioxygenase